MEHDGCWQSGCLLTDKEFNLRANYSLKLSTLIANDGWSCCYFWRVQLDDSKFRLLANPGNSVAYNWLDWDSSRRPFPRNAVYGDSKEECKLLVATYLFSTSHYATGHTQGAQVDKDGYVYHREHSFASNWYWDNNQYKLLVEKGIKAYKLIDINYDFPRANKRERKTISEKTVINHSNNEVQRRTSISVTVTESSDWHHGISWNVEHSGSFTISVGPEALAGSVEQTFGYSISLGGNHGWGGTSATTVTNSETVVVPLPGK